VQSQKLEGGNAADGRDVAAPRREATTTAIRTDSSTAAFMAAANATMPTVDTPKSIPGVTGRESRGRATTRVVVADVPLKEVGLVIPAIDQPGDNLVIAVDRTVNPLIQLARHLVKLLVVEILEQRRFREGACPLVIGEVDKCIELILGQGNLDVLVDGIDRIGGVLGE